MPAALPASTYTSTSMFARRPISGGRKARRSPGSLYMRGKPIVSRRSSVISCLCRPAPGRRRSDADAADGTAGYWSPRHPEGLEISAGRRARERDDISDVCHPRGVGHRPIKPQPEPGVRHGAVPAQIAIPPIRRGIQAGLHDPRIEHVEALLALAAADDLADAWGEHVHRRHSAFIVIQAHVERLDLLRVVDDHHRPFRVLLAEISLVLSLQRDAPRHRELPRTAGGGRQLPEAD